MTAAKRDAASRLRLLREIAALCRSLGITMSAALDAYERHPEAKP